MKYNTYGFKSVDGINLVCQKWAPENEKALICVIHGLGEHGGCYEQVAEYMTKKGYSLAVLDLRGHGHSDGKRGHIDYYDLFMQDIDTFVKELTSESPDLPCFLYGHSMGGNLAINYCLRYNSFFNGIIVTGPWLKLAFEPPKYKLVLAKLMNRVYPSFTQNNNLNEEKLYHKRDGASEFTKDPIAHSDVSARLFLELRNSGFWALEHAEEFKLPLLIIHGSEDEITSPKASMEFAEAAVGSTLKIWDGLYHVLHREPQCNEVNQYTIDWMEKHIK